MRLKQRLAALLVFLLVLLNVFPAFAVSVKGLWESEVAAVSQDSGPPRGTSGELSEPTDKPEDEPEDEPSLSDDPSLSDKESPDDVPSLPDPSLRPDAPLASPSEIPGPREPDTETPTTELPITELPITEPEEQTEIPVFSVELAEDGEAPGLYGTLSYIPEDSRMISVQYSFNGEDFYGVENSDEWGEREWDLTGLSEDEPGPELTQLCIGAGDHPYKAFDAGRVNSLFIRLDIRTDSGRILTAPVKQSNNQIWMPPDTLPEFSIGIESRFDGYVLMGTAAEFRPDTAYVRPMYSLDGENYEPVTRGGDHLAWDLHLLGTEEASERQKLQTQICAYSAYEPFKSYLNQELERFYIRLQITTEAGYTYDTQAACIERGGQQPLPEDTWASVVFPVSMAAVETGHPPYIYGKFQITAREDAAAEEVYALLPDTLPLEVQLHRKNSDKVIASGIVECEVTWKEFSLPTLTAGSAFTIRDAAEELVIPAGSEVVTPLGIYGLPEALIFDDPYARDEIRVVINAVGVKEDPDVSLDENTSGDQPEGSFPLSLAFRFKPSGATSVTAYSYADGDEEWIWQDDLLTQREVNANPSAALYGYADILLPDEYPYAEYSEGEIQGFLIGIVVEGGTFDGAKVILPWPGEYDPPLWIPELDGAGGNENNAGSGDGMGNGGGTGNGDGLGSGGNGGQRPDLPGEETPPTSPSDPSGNQSSGGGNRDEGSRPPVTPGPPETLASEPEPPVLEPESLAVESEPLALESEPSALESEQPASAQPRDPASANDRGQSGPKSSAGGSLYADSGGAAPDRDIPGMDAAEVGLLEAAQPDAAELPNEEQAEPAGEVSRSKPSGAQTHPAGTAAAVLAGGAAVTAAVTAAGAAGAGGAGAASAGGISSKIGAVLRKLIFRK